jgi:small multidrug resistance family-3 protein
MTLPLFVAAGLLEIGGCYLVWLTWRHGHPFAWAAGVVALAGFGLVLAAASADTPSRAYAAYGGIYIALALVWMAAVEGLIPDRWDFAGAAIAIAGALVILYGPRG